VRTRVSRIILGTSAAVFSTLELGILANKLGHLRWFWPYDDAVFSAGIIGGVVGAAFFYGAVAPEREEYLAKLDREEDLDT
jgi:Zn-dependent protease